MNIESIIHLAAVVGAWTAVGLAFITVVCVAFAERNAKPVEDDQFTPEMPWIPEAPIIAQKAQGDRFRDLEEHA